MTRVDLSITIPTYNRSYYLQHLLGSFVRQAGDLTHSYEIVISDNASTDDTEAVVKSFADKLPIVYIKRERNFGPEDNRLELLKHARGTVQHNMGDDDDLILSEVDKVVTQMLADPEIMVVFAPWKIYNRASGKMISEGFYPQENNLIIPRGDYKTLLEMVLKNQVFPEIYLIRSDLVQATSMTVVPLAYWAFVHTSEFLNHGKIAFNKNPFYITITQHFESDNRHQLGYAELLTAWDRYRGGLEYLISRIPPSELTPAKSSQYLTQIQKFIAMRISLSLRLRIASKFSPLDTYFLASRLRAMGYADLVPLDFDEIRIHAAAYYFLRPPAASERFDKVVCIGSIPELLLLLVRARATVPLIMADKFDPVRYPQAFTLIEGNVRDLKVDPATLFEHKIRLMGVGDLMRKFA